MTFQNYKTWLEEVLDHLEDAKNSKINVRGGSRYPLSPDFKINEKVLAIPLSPDFKINQKVLAIPPPCRPY